MRVWRHAPVFSFVAPGVHLAARHVFKIALAARAVPNVGLRTTNVRHRLLESLFKPLNPAVELILDLRQILSF